MRILCLTPWFPRHRQDQAGNFILDSVEALADLGHEVTVLVSQPWRPRIAGLINKEWKKKEDGFQWHSEKFNLHTCQYVSIPRGFLCSFSIWSYRHFIHSILEKYVRQYRCQLIHAHTEFAGMAAVDIGRKLHIPTVVTLHGVSTEKKLYQGNTKKLLFEYPLANSDRVVLVGDPLIQFANQFVQHNAHFRVVHNGFRFKSEYTKEIEKFNQDEPLRFISVSNLVEGKGIDINLYALAKIRNEGIYNWTYRIIGDGPERKKLELQVKQLNLSQQVKFLDACQHHKVYEYLQDADIFILPSYREAFGVAYVEAMSCGVLAIGVKGQGPEAFIEHEKTGLLIAPQDVNSLVNAIKSIFKSPQKMREIAKTGKNHVHQNVTWAQHAKKLTAVYEELM